MFEGVLIPTLSQYVTHSWGSYKCFEFRYDFEFELRLKPSQGSVL